MLWIQHQHRCIHDMIQNRDAGRSKHLVRDKEALYSLADSKLQYFLSLFFFFAIYQHPGNGIHTHAHTLALTTLPFSSITPCLAYATFPDAWTPVICLSSCFFITANSSLPEDLYISLFFWPGVFFSLIFSNYNVPPAIYTEFHFITAEFYTRNVIIFSIPIFYYRLMVVISLSILLPASVISRQWNGFVIHLSLLFKCHRCQYIGIFLYTLF